jgi:hypothetical protein
VPSPTTGRGTTATRASEAARTMSCCSVRITCTVRARAVAAGALPARIS